MHVAALILAALLQTLELSSWPGERFVLLPKPVKSQQYGYRAFDPALPYAEWVGKVLTVKSVEEGNPAKIVFMTDDGRLLHAEAYEGSVHDVALQRDFDAARARWVGKTLRLRVAEILTPDEKAMKVGKGTPVTVTAIVPGDLDYEPFRFLLRLADGREGFVDVQLTGTNISRGMRGTDTFDQLFSE